MPEYRVVRPSLYSAKTPYSSMQGYYQTSEDENKAKLTVAIRISNQTGEIPRTIVRELAIDELWHKPSKRGMVK